MLALCICMIEFIDRGTTIQARHLETDPAGSRSIEPGQAEPGRAEPGRADRTQSVPGRDDPSFFPLAVWLQAPKNAEAYQEVGINLFVGLWKGPTEAQLDVLNRAEMPVFANQNQVGMRSPNREVIWGWTQQDEPDNAQSDGQGGYGPCIDPSEIQARYAKMREADPSRPVFLNLGQGVAWDRDKPYIGRGSACADRWDHYPEYVKGADIVSFDIYPVTSRYPHIKDQLWRVGLGVSRLKEWTAGQDKKVWNVIETTHIQSESMPTPEQTRAEVWMSIIHGSQGIVYFAHEWNPSFTETGLLKYPEMREAVKKLNAEITQLAPVLNSPTLDSELRSKSSDPAVPIRSMHKRHAGFDYIFAISMRDEASVGTMRLEGLEEGTEIEVLGENRGLLAGPQNTFEDDFDGYEPHIYRIARGDSDPDPDPSLNHRILLPSLSRVMQ